jgi:acetyltransferase-like isoleucine patch superfamily enzyme
MYSVVTADRGAVESAVLGAAWLRATVLLRRHDVRHAGRATITGKAPRIRNRGTMVVGSRFAVRGDQFRVAIRTEVGGTLNVGDDVFINQGTTIHVARSVTIGSHVRIGDLCAIYDTSFHEVDPGEGVTVAAVSIGEDVWLARGVVVLPGTTIGAGTVIGANSVVHGTIPAGVVATGQPARAIRELRGSGRRR